MAEPADPIVGQVLDGRYRVLRRLGEGGMGEVYLVEHVHLARHEALKVLKPRWVDDAEFVSRFRREARALNRLQHPNIVAVYDFGQLDDGRLFLTMEYAPGKRIDAMVRKGSLALPRALRILAQLSSAIDHAHSLGVIHRDLKPQNLVLAETRSQEDLLKVLDFGVAKIIASDYQESRGISHNNEIIGSALYLSPEQLTGSRSDPRSDIYAIGCVAYELITGHTPFSGRPMDVLHAHATKRPERPSARNAKAGISNELDHLVLRCLEKEPDRRFQSGSEILGAIDQIRQSLDPPVVRPKKPRPMQEDTSERTNLDPPNQLGAILDADTQETILVSDGREASHATLVALGEKLLDLGCADIRFILAFTALRQLDSESQWIHSEMESIEHRLATIEQGERERERSIRFALGELIFARTQIKARRETPPSALNDQIRQLEHRLIQLASDSEQETAVCNNRLVALTAAQDNVREKVSQAMAATDRVISDVIHQYGDHAELTRLLSRWQRLRKDLPRTQKSATHRR